MADAAPTPRHAPFAVWTPGQRRVVGGLVLAASAGLMASLWADPATVPDPPGTGPRAVELAGRIDPNTASATALSAVPTLGQTRAGYVVAFREAWAREHPGRPAFAKPHDLARVHQIGEKTAANLAPFLRFPPPATSPGR